MKPSKRPYNKPAARTSWDPVAEWYQGMVGEGGHRFHRKYAIPALLDLLEPQTGEAVLDIGCGPAPLAPFVADAGARYVGVDASPKLLQAARQHHARDGIFLLGDARALNGLQELRAGTFDAVTFLLSVQDMDPLAEVLRSAAWALRDGGRAVLLLTHPCFRVPRQSGWGWDEGRKLRFRRVDRYLTPLPVPMKPPSGGTTRSYHRPLEAYINGLAANGLLTERISEIPAFNERDARSRDRADNLADREIPLFLALRARKVKRN